MNLVKTYIDKSTIHGIGLFAGEDIKKGTLIWEFKYPDFEIMKKEWEANKRKLTQVEIDYIETYSFEQDGDLYFLADDAKYSNHSLDANTICSTDKQIAKRNIKKGEEITSNYLEFDDNAKKGII